MEFNSKLNNIACQPASASNSTSLKQHQLDYYTSDGYAQTLNKQLFPKTQPKTKRFVLNFEEDTLTIVYGDGTNTIKNTQASKATTEKPKQQTTHSKQTNDHGLDYGLDPLPEDDQQEPDATVQEEEEVNVESRHETKYVPNQNIPASLNNNWKVPVLKNTKNKFLCKWRNKDTWKKHINLTKINGATITGQENNLIVLDIDVKDGVAEWQDYVKDHGDVQTLTVATPNKGLHYYFNYKTGDEKVNFMIENYLKNSTEYRGKGIDIRTNGGVVIMPVPGNLGCTSNLPGSLDVQASNRVAKRLAS